MEKQMHFMLPRPTKKELVFFEVCNCPRDEVEGKSGGICKCGGAIPIPHELDDLRIKLKLLNH